MVQVPKKLAAPVEGTAPPATAPAPEASGPGQVESLAALAGEASSLQASEQADADRQRQAQQQAGAEQQRTEQQQAQAALDAAAAEIAGALTMGRDLVADFIEEANLLPPGRTVEIWTDKRLAGVAAPLVLIVQKHGGVIGPFMERWGPFLGLGAALAMPTITTVKAVRQHRASVINVQAREVRPAPGPEAGQGG